MELSSWGTSLEEVGLHLKIKINENLLKKYIDDVELFYMVCWANVIKTIYLGRV